MKRIGLVKKKFLTRERIYLIVDYLLRHEKQRKWTKSIRREWREFYADLHRNVERIYWELQHKEFRYGDFICFDRVEKGKLRKIYASHPADQIVDQLLTDCLEYVFLQKKRIVAPTCYGSLRGKGQHAMRRKMIQLVKGRKDLYVGVCDTKKYYPTMSHDILFDMCRRHIKDEWLLWLSDITIRRMEGGKGLALGSPSSNILGHVYHAELDWRIILGYKVRRYYRFCDNKFVVHKDVQYVHTIMRALRDGIEQLGQTMKQDWRVVHCKDERFECLGSMINSHGARMQSKTRRSAEAIMRRNILLKDPTLAMRSWSGIRGALDSLSVSNLLDYWKDRHAEFFRLVGSGLSLEKQMKHRRRWHKKLQKILQTCPDMRSEENKLKYPLAA
ncbi:MAG: hypothetical protein ACI3Y0_00385 [Prevotella sp.]